MINTSLISDYPCFSALRSAWNPLLSQSPADNIFLTWEWISTWWEVFGEDKRLFVLTFSEDDKLVGIFPGYLHERSLRPFGRVRELRFLGTGETVRTEYLDLICLPGYREQCLENAAEFISRTRSWDIAVFSDLPGESSLIEVLSGRLGRYEIIDREPCYFVEPPPDFETYLQGIDSRMRRNIRNRRRNLERDCQVKYHRLGREEDLENWMGEFKRLHAARLEERGLPGKFSDPRYDLFHSRVSRLFQDRGFLYAAHLRVDGKMVAARYNFIYNGKLYDYQTGYDPRYGRKGVMQALISYIIEDCSTENIKEFDFLAGAEDYKRRFSTHQREVVTLRAVNSTPRGLVYDSVRKFKNSFKKVKQPSG